ncbi:MAG TPA: amino acid adenylation domain-containing protein [Thermoanaerobaculia bacterium]|nr:amino acid adenylation domain-containing protein [Thermoanaerobaculia bacterium]
MSEQPIEDLYPLSPMQQGMLFHALYAPRGGVHVWQLSCSLLGPLDADAFRRALARLLERHAALRTSFLWDDLEQPLQMVEREVPLPLVEEDWSDVPEGERRERFEALLEDERTRGFDLGQAPLTRLLLIREGAERHRLVWSAHLILADGWSLAGVVRDLFRHYEAFRAGQDPRFDPPFEIPRRFRDYIAWLQQQDPAATAVFWRRELAGFTAPTPLPYDSGPGREPSVAEQGVFLSAAETAALQALARSAQLTVNTLVQGAWALLLARAGGEREVVFGATVSGRPPAVPGVESMVGVFINSLPVRVEVDPEADLRSWLRRLQDRHAEARQHEHAPLVDVQGWSDVPRGTPLFESLLVFENYPVEESVGGARASLGIEDVRQFEVTSFPLTLQVAPGPTLWLRLAHDTRRVDGPAARRLLAQLRTLLAGMTARPEARLRDLALTTPAERHQLVVEWNDTAREYVPPAGGTLTGLIAAQVARTPEAPAVVFAGETISYAELDRRSGRLARRLQSLGCRAGTPVGVLMERSVEMVVALLGVLKAGGAYLPLDPESPKERLAWMIEDSGVSLLLAQEPLPEPGAAVLTLSPGWRGEPADDEPLEPSGASGDTLAYVLYTSGSTGRPKAVMVPHRGIVNRLLWMQEAYGLTPADRVLQKTPYGFDVSVWEFFWPLMTGATLVVARPGGHRDSAYLAELIPRERVTVVHFVPSMLQIFLEEPDLSGCAGLRLVVASGEALPPELRLRCLERLPARLENLYGPTEASVDVTSWDCRQEAPRGVVPIGRPIANIRIHLLDRELSPTPVGVPGELHIAGVGLARGYLKRPDLTAERFLPDPFAAPGERLYRTGDLARRLPDGAVEYLGRLDHQVKIRGFRIELGEIEAVLAAQPGVREAVVLARADGPSPRLVAYVVPRAGQDLDVSALRAALGQSLPEPMVPAAWVVLATLPLSSNGKVDRRALPAPEAPPPAAGEEALPRGEAEEIVAAAWREVLHRDAVGRNDNFFDLGGHSLLLIQVQGRLRRALEREIELVDLFRHPTVAAMAAFLSPSTEMTPAERSEVLAVRPPAPVASGGRIAIVGMAGRFPGAPDVASFWRNLRDGVESIARLTDEDLDAAGVDAATRNDPAYVRAAGVLDGIDQLDAGFFGFTPRDAEITDPQHRLFLEVAWQALEDAGCDPATFRGPIGVFAGVSLSRYLFNLYSNPEILASVGPYKAAMANDKDYLTTAVSYKLDLKGPSLDVQTSCSTSLVALHLACRSLLAGECDMALVGGSSIALPHRAGYLWQEGGIRSPDGHCRAFDARAQGMVSGSGAGVVVLKRLEDALAEGDSIRAVILGSALNNDGSLKVGYTAPSVDGQARVIASALAAAGAGPRSISYVEAHGTGTPLGDPIEVAALTQVYRRATGDRGFCALGSVKTNVGHLDAAAGVTGLIKAVLALENRQIPPSLHFETPNPAIDLAASPFYVNARLADWSGDGGPRRAGVSSFGIGGTNAHVILEEAPAPAAREGAPARPWRLLTLSARTPTALEAAAANLRQALEERPDLDLDDAAWTLQTGRRAFAHRRAVLCRDRTEALAALGRSEGADQAPDGGRGVVFLFPGQGAQYPGMGHDLDLREPVYRRELDRAAEILGYGLQDLLAPGASAEALEDTAVAQPALFAVEHALARLWMSWGVHPEGMMGHSIGEYVAACLAGVLSFEEALELVALRGRLVAGLGGRGAMASLPLPEAELRPRLSPGLSLAAVNGPTQCVVSGPEDEVLALLEVLSVQGIEGRRLHTSHAFHSALMEPAMEELAAAVARIRLAPPRIPYVSNVTGTWIQPGEATDPSYWARHLRATVRFADGLGTLLARPGRLLLEVGPGRTLASLARRHPERAAAHAVLTSLRHPEEAGDDGERMAATLGQLWAAGVPVDWAGFHAGESLRRVPLPTYPFERRRYWIEARTGAAPAAASGELERKPLADWFYAPFWKPAPLPAAAPAGTGGAPWLVFVDDTGLGTRVLARLRRAGVEAVTAVPGAGLERREDYDGLLRRAFPEAPPTRVLHLWSVSPAPADLDLEERLAMVERAQDLGFYSVLFLVQALAERGMSPGLRLDVVTSHALKVAGDDVLCPEKATLGGLCRTVPREYPGVVCRQVDVALPAAGRGRLLDALAERLTAEALSAAATEPAVAWRGGERWTPGFQPLHVEAPAGPPPLPAGGSYLITGGFGGIGLEVAERLASEGPARLVLVGRSGLPPEEEWDALLAGEKAAAPDREAAALAGREIALRQELGVRGMASREGMEPALDAWCAARIHRFLAESGLDVSRGARHRVADVRRHLRLQPKLDRLLDFMLRTLAEDGWARCEEDAVVFVRAPEEVPDPGALAREALERFPALRPMIATAERCAAQYGPALSGDVEAVGVLFGGSEEEGTAEDFGLSYEPVYSTLAAELAQRLAERTAGSGRKLRVLEFGGGQGRLTRHVAPLLAGRNVEYWFTDLGRLFVTQAEREADRSGLGFMRFGRLDISADPGPQGFEPEGFDLLLGLNVVHATRDVEASLRNLRRLLRPGGTLCLIETIKRERWVDMVWGLAEGWWYFEDSLRSDHAVLSLDLWREALRRTGFTVQASLPADPLGLSDANCGLVLATRPGAQVADGDGLAGRIARVRRLRDLGAEVVVEAADVADPAAVRSVILRARERFGRLDGVLHTAGVPGGGMLALKERESVEAEFAAKVRGTVILSEVCREVEPGGLVLFSSVSSYAAQFGQGGYCAGNAFVDAWAHSYAAETGIRTVAINWDRWQSLGMAVAVERYHQVLTGEEIGGGLTAAEGFEALRRALASGLSQVIVSTVDFPAFLARFTAPASADVLNELRVRPVASSSHGRPDLPTAYAAPAGELEQQIAGLWQEVFGIEGIGVRDDFFALGGDSLVAIQLAARIGRAFGVELKVRDLFDAPTIAALAERIAEAAAPGPAEEAIPRRTDGGPQPLSSAQQRLWFLAQLAPASSAYNISRVLRLDGPLNVGAFARSLQEIVRRHEVLRTTFEVREGLPVQVVGPPPANILPEVDLSVLPGPVRTAESRRLAVAEVRRPFDLARGPMLRTTLLRLGPAERHAVFTMHHIVCDERSIALFVDELTALYEGFAAGRPAVLPELPIQYADFARWQRGHLEGGVLEEQLGWWKRQLAGPLPVAELPADRPRPAVQTYRGGHRYMSLPGAAAEALRRLGRERGATSFMTLLAALQTLLGRWSGQEDVTVGSPVTYRNRVETEPLIGFFVNALVLRGDLSGDPPFCELLDRTREAALGAYAHQDLPFEKLVEELQPDRDLSRPPLFQVFLIVQSGSRGTALELPGLALASLPVESGTARIDLGFEIIDHPDGLMAEVEYSADLFEAATVERLAGHFATLLRGIAADPGQRLSELPLLTEAERHQVLVEWIDAGPATSGTVHGLFFEQARLRPEAPALVFEDTVVSYGELAARAGRLARRLRAAGVGLETPVGLLAERSPDAIAGLFGILAAGGCYVPLDPDYPAERLELMLRDAGVAAVAAQERFAPALASLGKPVIALDGPDSDERPGPVGPEQATGSAEGAHTKERRRARPGQDAGEEHAAYVIYTSGSLGRPKGVQVRHGALANFARAIVQAGGIGPGERMFLFAPLAFDASALQIFPPLISGAALVLERHPGRLEPREILDLCERQGVTVLDLPAAVWRQWIEEMADRGERILPRVGTFFTGGESLTAEKLRSWARLPARPARLLSSYGPTEATVTTTLVGVESDAVLSLRWEKIPLGRPLPGTRLHLLDRNRRPVPVGVPGEIFIGGAGVARGYLGRPELTAEAFVPVPESAAPGERLYRTGDLARWLPDGNLEFLGRADHQVKIRGFRVELGEIEGLLARHPALREAVVAAPEEASGTRRLVAYVVPEPGEAPAVSELRAYLAQALPDFMVPTAFMALDALPLLPSGKVDRRALPAPEAARLERSASFVDPRDPLEQVLADIWAQVLKVERVGAFDNFFELGGHSLMATQALARIRQAFEIELQLRSLFEEPTVAGLAAVLRNSPDADKVEKTAALRVQLAGLSEDEIEALLLAEAVEERSL